MYPIIQNTSALSGLEHVMETAIGSLETVLATFAYR